MNTIYISANGCNMKGAGTFHNPFASFEYARDFARSLCGKTRIYVREGKYFFEQPLELNEQDSNCSYMAYPGDKVILSGSKTYRGLQWRDDPVDTSIKCTYIGKGLQVDQLYINGKPQIMARYPDYRKGVIPLGGVVTEDQIKKRSRKWAHPETGYIRALHSAGWGGNDYYITGKNDLSPLGLSIEWNGDNNRGNQYKKDAILAENIREELDSEGEWFYDAETGILSFMPEEDISCCDELIVELTTNTEIFRLKGNNHSNPIKNVVISGFVIENTGRTMFTTRTSGKEYISLLRGDWAVVRSGSIYMENAENVTIEKCEFLNIGGNAVFGWGYNANHRIIDNEFQHVGSTAIQLVGSPSAVSEPSFWEHKYYPQHIVHATAVERPDIVGPVSEEYPRDIEIKDNHIYDVGIYEKQSSGINLSVASRIRIICNTIHKSARSNININDGTFGGHEIAYNDIFDSQTETADHGPFNSWGRDRFWSVPERNTGGLYGEHKRHYLLENKEYDISTIDAYQTTTIHNNRFHHNNEAVHSWGIDLDDGSSNYEIYENICLGIGIKLREGFDRRVHHNIIIDGQMQIHCTYKEARDKIYSNLFVHSKPWGFAGLGGEPQKRLAEGELFVDQNAYYYETGVEFPEFWMDLNYDTNVIVNENPCFKNPKENDYTITNLHVKNALGFPDFTQQHYGKHNCNEHAPIYIRRMLIEPNLDKIEWKGAVISNINQAIMSATATAGTDGVYFENVPESSEAYRLGYRTNQIIKHLKDVKIDNIKGFIEVIRGKTDESSKISGT